MAKTWQRNRLPWLASAVFLLLAAHARAVDLPELDCVIEPHMVVDVSSRVDGIVETVAVERGDLVDRNQVLIQLDSGVEQAARDHARARANATTQVEAGEVSVAFAHRRQGRLEPLHRESVVSSDLMDEAQTESRLTRLKLQQAQENKKLAQLELRQSTEILERHTIRSPIRGVVVQRFLSPGESVVDQPIMRVAQIDPLRVEVIVPVSLFGLIKIGQAAIIRPEAPKQGEYAAKVSIVDRVADAASGTFRVRLSLPNPDYSLPSGLKCQVAFADVVEPPPAPTVTNAAETASTSRQVSLSLGKPSSPGQTTADSWKTASMPSAAAIDSPPGSAQSAQNAGLQCRAIGPIEDATRAEEIRAAIAPQVSSVSLREELVEAIAGYMILSPRQDSREEAQLLADRIREAGINDLYVFRRGRNANRISYGYYAGEQWPEDYRRRLVQMGFETELVADTKETTRFWLNVDLPAGEQGVRILTGHLDDMFAESDAMPLPCERLLANAAADE